MAPNPGFGKSNEERNHQINPPPTLLPKDGAVVRGIDEKLAVNSFAYAGLVYEQIAAINKRLDFGPKQLQLSCFFDPDKSFYPGCTQPTTTAILRRIF